MRTVGMERFRKFTLARLRNAYLALVVLVILGAFFLPDRPIVSALVGVISAGLIMGTSAYTLNQMVKAEHIGLGWLMIDYLVKIAVAAGAVLLTKYVFHDDPLLVAIAVIAAAVFTAMVPVMAAQAGAQVGMTDEDHL